MIKSVKIVLHPTKEQKELMFRFSGATKFIYNWALNRWNEMYKEWEDGNSKTKPTGYTLQKELTHLKKTDGYTWLKAICSVCLNTTCLDLDKAFQMYFKGIASRPTFKGKKYNKFSFATNYKTLTFTDKTVNISKIGRVKYSFNQDIEADKYSNPRVVYDGKYWYLTCGIERGLVDNDRTKTEPLGIDLGVKWLAVLSNGDVYGNINKTETVRKLQKRLKRKQRQLSRKYEMNKVDGKFVKTKNIIKLEKEIKVIYRRISNIRNNYIHNVTADVIKMNPERVVMEDLNVSGMMKNKHLSRAIQEQNLYEVKRILKYKCEYNQIDFVEADRWFASSKTCSNCGSYKKGLQLSHRTFICDECGFEIDRDLNAAINLSKYKQTDNIKPKKKRSNLKIKKQTKE